MARECRRNSSWDMNDSGTRRRAAWAAVVIFVVAAAVLALATLHSLREFSDDPLGAGDFATKPQVLARDGTPLSYTLENYWNTTDVAPLSSVPTLLQRAFIAAEDQHFYEHHGVDWPARFAAVWQNLRALSAVRGAGSITEQVVRMIHPRPRTMWSHWVEGFEAASLERRVSKAQILAFYLNQVPYADRRRGVVQAARLYFDRGLDTLSPAEQLSLAVLVRSPRGMDLRRNLPRAQRAIDQLADRLARRGDLTAGQRDQVHANRLLLRSPIDVLDAGYFVSHVLDQSMSGGQRLRHHHDAASARFDHEAAALCLGFGTWLDCRHPDRRLGNERIRARRSTYISQLQSRALRCLETTRGAGQWRGFSVRDGAGLHGTCAPGRLPHEISP